MSRTTNTLCFIVFRRGGQEYEQITKKEKKVKPELWLNLAVCFFYLGMYQEAKEVRNRMFQCHRPGLSLISESAAAPEELT